MGINSGAGVIDRLILSLRAKTLREIFDIYATCEKKIPPDMDRKTQMSSGK